MAGTSWKDTPSSLDISRPHVLSAPTPSRAGAMRAPSEVMDGVSTPNFEEGSSDHWEDICLSPTEPHAAAWKHQAFSPITPDWWLPSYDSDPLDKPPQASRRRCEQPCQKICREADAVVLTPEQAKPSCNHDYLLNYFSAEETTAFRTLASKLEEWDRDLHTTNVEPPASVCCPTLDYDVAPDDRSSQASFSCITWEVCASKTQSRPGEVLSSGLSQKVVSSRVVYSL